MATAVSFSLYPFTRHHHSLPSPLSKPPFLPPIRLTLSPPLLTPLRLSSSPNPNPNPNSPDQTLDPTSSSSAPSNPNPNPNPEPSNSSPSDTAAELKEMLRERKEKESDSLLSGVGQEISEIEWPELRKVVGTTGVVLAVITGSTAALLSVNGLLAELSERVFAGKGIQDFF